MIEVKQQLVSENVINNRSYGRGNPGNYIVVHQTGNTNKGANAQAHANIQSNMNPREASWHYSVDEEEIIQSFSDDVKCWATGDGRGKGNSEGIQVELCINSDGDYAKTIENGARLVRFLLDKHNLGIDKVKQHFDFTPKNCPAQLRAGKDGITWANFLEMVAEDKDNDEVQHVSNPVKPKPQPKPESKPKSKEDKVEQVSTSEKGKRVSSIYKGSDGLNFYSKPTWDKKYKVGVFMHGMGWTIVRKLKVDGAHMYEVKNSKNDIYYITASPTYVKVEGQSKPVSKPKPKPKKSIAQMAQEIIDNKHGNGHSNRQKSLGISASEYEKVRAEVNRLLVSKLSKPKKSIKQMADEIIKGIHGSGHENRRKSLGISKADYEKVRAEVNKRL